MPKRIQGKLPFDFNGLSEEGKSYVKTAVTTRKRSPKWRGMPSIPPGSLLDSILREFYRNTNIPLEIPFATFLHYISGYLVGKEVKIKYGNHETEMDFWSIVLAKSGAGKTWTEVQIADGLKDVDVPILPTGSASAATFIEKLSRKPRALFIRDEMLQFLKQMDIEGGPQSEMKDYLLRIYDNQKIERDTKKESFVVEKPVLSFLGFNALASFVEGLSGESLVDGFAQRFSYMIARPDPARPFENYPVWTVDKTDWRKRFDEMLDNVQPVYIANSGAEKKFSDLFKEIIGNVDIEESFYRRIMWRAHKYAVIYHIIRGESKNPVISDEDYGWAARLIEMQMVDAAELIEMCSGSSISRAIDAAESVIKKLREKGKPVTPRNIVAGTRLIASVGMAKFVMECLGVEDEGRKKRELR